MLETAESTDLWLRRYFPAPQAPHRLVCLPHAGGSASYFLQVSRMLAPGIDVLAAQYPGRQDRRSEPCVATVAELADRLAAVIKPWADRPLSLFGHSMGAVLSFEVAYRLEAEGVEVAKVFASGRRAPGTHRDERVHLRDDNGLIAELKSLAGTDSRVMDDDELLRMALPSIRSDYKAVETYECVPGRKIAADVHALVGDADPKATVEEARRWAEHTTGSFELSVFPGGHFYLDQHVPAVLDAITTAVRG
ncbi:thioesterase II family protein [Labedaea rhizosphaerae]|uniref:Surfactin synthase thioesterase subunit n=1 Tax=Labedaea rhizosphaerae TaxID=598644 RepID=A0A4R6S1K7_LABRH|nr:alpha/beta fold hydrolase [Labedaea rhizosphaerae]TDP92867.1 surfactin synthase thioesterase subunit [Labedaea rhizosphaerae]